MEKEIRCVMCGSRDVIAKIEGKYYCYKCGSRIIKEHMDKVLEELRRKGLIVNTQ